MKTLITGLTLATFAFGSVATAAPTMAESSDEYDSGVEEATAPGERAAKNSVYAELLGPGGLYSINFDRFVAESVALRVGLSYISATATATGSTGTASSTATLMTLPLTVSYLGIGNPSHMFEIGGGIVGVYGSVTNEGGSTATSSDDVEGAGAAGTLLAGYRYQPPEGGFMLRVGLSSFVGTTTSFAWPYLSLGGGF